MKKPLQGQHYKMAAIIAKGWAYDGQEERLRWKSVCQFNTKKFLEFTKDDKKKSGKNLFSFMKIKENRNKKIEKCISDDPQLKNGRNTVIDKIFMSHLIRQETEDILHTSDIEKNFLKLLEVSDNFNRDKETLLKQECNQKIIKDYIALQHCRNPLYYRFLFNGYFAQQLKKMSNNIEENHYRQGYPVGFKELSILDSKRLNIFLDFANNEIIKIFTDFRKFIEDLTIVIYSNEKINNYLGDMSCFSFNFSSFGMNSNDIQDITDYKNNKEILDNTICTIATSTSCIIAVDTKYFKTKEEFYKKLDDVIYPVIEKGLHNNMVFLYSKYVICNPSRKDIMIQDMKNFFDLNYKNKDDFLEYFINCREEEIEYLEVLENLLIQLKEKEENYR